MSRKTMNTGSIRRWLSALLIVLMIASVLIWWLQRDTLPESIQIYSGHEGGLYHQLATAIAESIEDAIDRPVVVRTTTGSVQNYSRLKSDSCALAIVQGGSVDLQPMAVVTPLFPEMLFVIVRNDSEIRSIQDLAGHHVALGERGSGSRHSALALLGHFHLTEADVEDHATYFADVLRDAQLEAAIVTAGVSNDDLRRVMLSGKFRLLSVHSARAVEVLHPFFRATSIPRGLFGTAGDVPATPVETVATTAFLVTRPETPSAVVNAALRSVHEQNLRMQVPALIRRSEVEDHLATRMHPVARQYFRPADHIGTMANIMESLAATKELLFAFGAGLYLLWLRYCKLREQEKRDRLSRHKERLDVLLEKTLAIESQQMRTNDMAKLSKFLDQVTAIKLQALNEFTSEELRGDQAFSIFLDQCTGLIAKLQMKLLIRSTDDASADRV